MDVLSLLLVAIIAFAFTNIDDLVVLAFFFANPVFQVRQVVVGQYLGIVALVALNLLGYLAALLIPTGRVRFLGMLPSPSASNTYGGRNNPTATGVDEQARTAAGSQLVKT